MLTATSMIIKIKIKIKRKGCYSRLNYFIITHKWWLSTTLHQQQCITTATDAQSNNNESEQCSVKEFERS